MLNFKTLIPTITIVGVVALALAFSNTGAQAAEFYSVPSEGEITDMGLACEGEPTAKMRQGCADQVGKLRNAYAELRQSFIDLDSFRDAVEVAYPSILVAKDTGL